MGVRDRFESVQDWLYVIIVIALAAYFVIGLFAWTWMILVGVVAPDAFTTIQAAVAGALAGVLSPLRAPSGGEPPQSGPSPVPPPR